MRAQREGVRVEVMTDLAAARSRWEVLETWGAATPFQSFAWVSTLAQTVGPSFAAKVFVVVVRDVGSGRDLMLLPLVRRSLGPMRMIELPDFGLADYCAPILAPEVAAAPDRFLAVWQSALAAIPSADVIRINKVPEHIDDHANPCLRLPGVRQKAAQSWRVDLPQLWCHYEDHALSSKFKSNIRRSLKKLNAVGTVQYCVAHDAVSAEDLFDAMCLQREVRFRRIGRANVLATTPVREFYRAMVHSGLKSGLVVLSALKIDATVVATILGLCWRNTFFALIPTMTESTLHGHALGKLMNWFQIKEMHARGCRRFDFTIGNEPYKRDYGAVPKNLYEVTRPLGLAGVPLAWALGARAKVTRWRQSAAFDSTPK